LIKETLGISLILVESERRYGSHFAVVQAILIGQIKWTGVISFLEVTFNFLISFPFVIDPVDQLICQVLL